MFSSKKLNPSKMKDTIKYIGIFLIFILSFKRSVYAQKIDYSNFDSRHASLVLFKKLNEFRDTITQNGLGKSLDSSWSFLKDNREMLQLNWSEQLYKTVVLPNTIQNVEQKKLFHVDRSSWWSDKKNQFLFLDEVYPTNNKGFRLTLSENGGYSTYKFETYEQMADHMIMCWESSLSHRCAQRSILHNMYFYELGYKSYTIAATCVLYSDGVFYFFVDFVY
jgi:hypothetical protein